MTTSVVVIARDSERQSYYTHFLGTTPGLAPRCHETCDSDEGLLLIEDLRPDCVLVDVSTAGLNGLEILDRIHEIDPALPVIVLNDVGHEFTAIEAFRCGAWDYLIRSTMTPQTLRRAIESTMNRADRPRTSDVPAKRPAPRRGHRSFEPTALNAAILDCARVMIIATAKDGTILEFNQAAEENLGYSAEEVVGKETVALLHDAEEIARHAGEAREPDAVHRSDLGAIGKRALTFGVETREWWYIRKDGSRFLAELTISPLRDDRQRLVGYLAIGQDISHRKEMDRIKDEFVSVVSHELRTPMTAVMGAIGLVTSGRFGGIDPGGLELLQVAHRNCQRLVRLITQTLDIERMASGRAALTREDVGLSALLSEAVLENEAFATVNNCRLQLRECPEGVFIRADRDKISQVLTNLISNAAKFSGDQSKVEISASFDGKTARISVTDHGIGIPESFHEQIFGKFAQADTSDTRRRDGSGLGLNIVKTIIEAHGGAVSFDTRVGKGTTFHVELEAWRSDQAPAPRSNAA